MYYLGIDIGTTSISFAVVDERRQTVYTQSLAEDRFLPGPFSWERIQDVEKTISLILPRLNSLTERFSPIAAIGITGQMHGILYTDREGRAISPLYTWQDMRGAQADEQGLTAAEWLTCETGCPLSPGYGLVTHHYNRMHHLIPVQAAGITTIGGYLGMVLTGRKTPLLHASDAASLGAWKATERCFALTDALLPEVTCNSQFIGYTNQGIPVSVCLGDNQASFLGSVERPEDSLLVNIGTGSQVSAYSPNYVRDATFETRPYLDGAYLLVGCPLCGGRAYALLERFMRQCAELGGCSLSSLYPALNELAARALDDVPAVLPTFCGTRQNPEQTGAILGLTEDNFTPAHLTVGLLRGMADELHGFYRVMQSHLNPKPVRLVGSGNGLSRNPALQRILSDQFGLPLTLSGQQEEAARGAALFAMRCHSN